MRTSWIGSIAFAALLMVSAGCGPSDRSGPPASMVGAHAFSGRWTVMGKRHRLGFVEGRRVTTFHARGAIHMTGGDGVLGDLNAELVGLTDSLTGCSARCVWSNASGERIFSEISGNLVGRGGRAEGKIVGGTGKFVGAGGTFSFTWASFIVENETRVDGFTNDLSGTLLIAAPAAQPGGNGEKHP